MLVGEELWPDEVTAGLVSGSPDRPPVYRAEASLYDLVAQAANGREDKVCLGDWSSQAVTYRELLARVEASARALASCGVEPGQRVGCLMDNSIGYVVVYLAINALGAVFCPLPGKFRHEEVVSLARKAGLSLIVCDPGWCGGFSEGEVPTEVVNAAEVLRPGPAGSVPPQGGADAAASSSRDLASPGAGSTDPLARVRRPQDTAIVMFTSGTTSGSKAVVLSNRAVVQAVTVYQRVLSLDESVRSIIAVPMYHVTGLVAIIGVVLASGGYLRVCRRLHPHEFLGVVDAERISFIHASPTVFALLLAVREDNPDMPTVRMLACGAAHMPVGQIRALHEWMVNMEFRTVYGLTETTSPGTVFPCDAATSPHLGSSGIPVPGLRVRIMDEEGRECPTGQVGEIWLQGSNLLTRYEGDCGTDKLHADGWLQSGDVGYVTEDGYLYVVDRLKDMINRGGEKVWCTDVEEAIRALPGVRDCCVVGVADPVYGETPAALVALDQGRTWEVEELRAALRDHLAGYELPTRIRMVDEVPLTPGLKVDKRAARMLLAA